MTTKMTKREMFKEIVFDATNGRRTSANFVDGMTLLDLYPAKVTTDHIKELYDEWLKGEKSARRILSREAYLFRVYGTMPCVRLGKLIDKVLDSTRK